MDETKEFENSKSIFKNNNICLPSPQTVSNKQKSTKGVKKSRKLKKPDKKYRKKANMYQIRDKIEN